MVRNRTTTGVVVTLCAAALAGAACGKKGSPVAPIVRIPAAVAQISASRLGSDVYVTLTVPRTNVDGSLPADIGRIEVYGYTGRIAPLAARWAELGDLVGTIEVAPPPFPDKPVPLPEPGVVDPAGAVQGTVVTIHDALTREELVQGRVDPIRERRTPVPVRGTLAPTVLPPLRRFYLAIPFSRRGRPGPPGAQTEITFIDLPKPPTTVRATYTSTAVSLTWEPAGGLLGFLLDRNLPLEPLPYEAPLFAVSPVAAPAMVDTSVPPGPTTYNVYRELAPDPLFLPDANAAAEPIATPAPVNAAPLTGTSLEDTVVELGRQRCYYVRGVRLTAQGTPVVTEPSERMCFTPVDVFPPAAPAGLATVPSEGGISLIWEPNSELDLGGYLVLRGEVGDATLRLLTERPIAEARFRDADVNPGTRYLYYVVAVDNQLPLPNMSTASAPVEETAR